MKLFSDSFKEGETIPGKNSFAVYDAENHLRLSDNLNPHLRWEDIPAATRSLVLLCHDPDVPSEGENVNQPGRTVAVSLPRINFFHWALLNIPPEQHEIAEGSQSSGITVKGKPGPDAPHGLLHGINDYTYWFAGDESMAGEYYGYDGPCPPWNDELVHRYIFTLYALPTAQLPISGELTGAAIFNALNSSNILARATLTGIYSLNPEVTA